MEKQLEIFKRALKMGARFHIGFYDAKSEEEAKAQIQPFAELLEQSPSKASSDNFHWIKVEKGKIEVTSAFQNSKEDKIAKLKKQLAELEGTE